MSVPHVPMQNNGILLVDKAVGSTSFHLVSLLRKRTGIKKIGHAGTLDPFATGLMVMLIGKEFTKKSDQFLNSDKEYIATLHLGLATDTFDTEGHPQEKSDHIPTLAQIATCLETFQGEILQTPPMFSAKKIGGKKLYELARKGITIERPPSRVTIKIALLSYEYPTLKLKVECSKGTYIRSLGHDIGLSLGCYAHLSSLQRTKSGSFSLKEAISEEKIKDVNFNLPLKVNI